MEEKEITLNDMVLIKHPYYASDSNYYDRNASAKYQTWSEFYDEFKDADVDMNLIYRWDINERNESGTFELQLFMIHQRKGIYAPIRIIKIEETDIKEIVTFLKPHFQTLMSIWAPLDDYFLKSDLDFPF